MAPNARVLELRRGLLGDAPAGVEAASSPLDLALAREWIGPELHLVGRLLDRVYHRSGIGGGRLATTPRSFEVDERTSMPSSDAEINAIWDRVFGLDEDDGEARAARAERLYRRLMDGAGPLQREVFAVCVLEAWPVWMTAPGAQNGWARLRRGLQLMREQL